MLSNRLRLSKLKDTNKLRGISRFRDNSKAKSPRASHRAARSLRTRKLKRKSSNRLNSKLRPSTFELRCNIYSSSKWLNNKLLGNSHLNKPDQHPLRSSKDSNSNRDEGLQWVGRE